MCTWLLIAIFPTPLEGHITAASALSLQQPRQINCWMFGRMFHLSKYPVVFPFFPSALPNLMRMWGISSLTPSASITGLMNPPIDHKDDWWVRQFSMRGWRRENRHGDNERIAPSSLPPHSSSAFLPSRDLLVKLHLCRCINKKLIVMRFDYFHHSDKREREGERKKERERSCQIFPHLLIFMLCFNSQMKFGTDIFQLYVFVLKNDSLSFEVFFHLFN